MRVLNVRTDVIPPAAIYIGRNPEYGPTKYGNPYRIGRDGTREQCIERYRRRLWRDIQAGRITRAELAAMAPHDVLCHCAPAPCHGDVVVRAVQWARGA